MRLSLWIIPTALFVAAAAAIVQREAPEAATADATSAPADAVESAAASRRFDGDASDPHTAAVEQPGMKINATASDFDAIPPGQFPQPVWKIIDRDFPGDVLAPSDIPILAISNSKAVSESRPVEEIAAAEARAKSAPPWEVIGHSVGNLPIHIRRYGSVGEATLIVCGLDGTDRIAVKWLDELSQQLNDAPQNVSERRIILLRDPNPDGLTAKRAVNQHGVLLNRNFPSTQYRPGAEAGPGPASEPETRAVLEVIYRYQPKRIIHLQSAGKSEVAANPAARQLAELLKQGRQLAMEQPELVAQPGSLEEFASVTMGAEVLSLRLATGDDWRSAAIGHFPTLLAAAIPKVATESLAVAQTARLKVTEPVEDLAPSPFGDSNAISRLERSGFEELPPPPNKPTW